MLKKIISIQNIGRFENPSTGACEFLRWNVIKGENGRGKSTLTALLRSVGENKPNYILARQTLGQADSPRAKLLFSDAQSREVIAEFDGTRWDKNPGKLLVFDQDFIEANVFIGGHVDYPQKLGLYEIFVGRQTGSIFEKITDEDEKIRLLNGELFKARAEIDSNKKSPISTEDFISLEKPKKSVNPIPALEKSLQAIQGKAAIMQNPPQQEVEYKPPQLEKIDTVLLTSVKTLSVKAREAVKNKIEAIGEYDAETWIEKGHEFAKKTDGKCPYCSQQLLPSEIAKHYDEYFNQEYKRALKDLVTYKEEALRGLDVGSLLSLGRVISDNEKAFGYWKTHIEGLEEAKFEIAELQKSLVLLGELTTKVLDMKLQAPLTSMKTPLEVKEAITDLSKKLEELKKYNEAIRANNQKIASFKSDLQKVANTQLIQNELNKMYDQRIRYTPTVEKLCQKYKSLITKKTKSEAAKLKFREKLDSESKQMLERHQRAINEILSKFGASFTIQRIDQDHVGGKPNSTFVLEINGEEVAADSRSENAPSLKSALSGGDRTTLAFAIFASCAAQDVELSKSVLIIDDPISSLDYERRGFTASVIFDLFSRSRQGILLSHDADFLHGAWIKMGASPADRASFQIKRSGRASAVETWSVEKYAESEQKVRVATLQEYVDEGLKSGQTLQDVIVCVRPVLEHAYKALYPKEFSSESTFGGFILSIKQSDEAYLSNIKLKIDRLEKINEYVRPYSSHDAGNAPAIVDTELLVYVKDTLNLLHS